MFTGNIYYRGDRTAAEDVLHEASQLANLAVAKRESLGIPNFREQFTLSSGATLDVVINEHQQFITIVGFGEVEEPEPEEILEEEEERYALFICQPEENYPQVVVYATENKITEETKISVEWGDDIKGGVTYSQFRGDTEPELISLENTSKSQYVEGTTYSDDAGTKAYVGGYTMVDADLPLLGAAKVKTTDPNTDEVFEALCFVAYDDPNNAVKLYYHPLIAEIDYESTDHETPLIDWADCTLFETISFKQYAWRQAAVFRYNNDFTLATFDEDGTTCVFSALKGRYRQDPNYPSDVDKEEENRQDLWTLTLEASKDPGDGHIVLEVINEEYELITVTSKFSEDNFTAATSTPAATTQTTVLEDATCGEIITSTSYNVTYAAPHIRNSSWVTSRNGEANKGAYFSRVVDKDGGILTADQWKQNLNIFSADYGGALGTFYDSQGFAGGTTGDLPNTSIASTIITHMSTNTYGPASYGRYTSQHCTLEGLCDYNHPLYTSGVPLIPPAYEDDDVLEGAKKYTVTFPHFVDDTKEKKLLVTFAATGYWISHDWSGGAPIWGVPNYNTVTYGDVNPPNCPYAIEITYTEPPMHDHSIAPGTYAERPETRYSPLNFALREGVSISARYTKPSKPVEFVLQYGEYPYPGALQGQTLWFIGPDTTPDYTVRGSCSITLESKFEDREAVIVDLPDIRQYDGDLPDQHVDAVLDARFITSLWASSNYVLDQAADNTMYRRPATLTTSIFSYVWHECTENIVWQNDPDVPEQDPVAPQVPFCSHPRRYQMFSTSDKYMGSYGQYNPSYYIRTWSVYDQKNNEFTDLYELYNELLAATPALASFAPLTRNAPRTVLTPEDYQPDFMYIYGMVSKIPVPQLRTP